MLPRAFDPLPLGAVRPTGWLLRQLRLQADGLGGHLDEIWPDVRDSKWVGGDADGWERAPYWLDGFLPLAHLLQDEDLVARATRYVDGILERQEDDGWFGPTFEGGYRDAWPVFVVFKALLQHAEATGDERVVPAMLRAAKAVDALWDRLPLHDWGAFRWADLAVSLVWLHDRTGEQWLLDLAEKGFQQSFDWQAHLADFPYLDKQRVEVIHPAAPPYPEVRFRTDLASHVVNLAMAVKQPGLRWQLTGDLETRQRVYAALADLDRFHGLVTGVFTGDEHLAGNSPSQGTELCAVVEECFSLSRLVGLLGDPLLADRLERIAFNALPGAWSDDYWAHQYVQQVNQVVCHVTEDRVYTNNDADANVFGLEPHFGCCTANFSQGWPKLVSHLWMRTPDGLAVGAWAPCVVEIEVHGRPVRVEVVTDYPFRDTVLVRATGSLALDLRVPGWAVGATVDGDVVEAGSYHRVDVDGEREVVLRFPMSVRVERRPDDAAALLRGPLVFSVPIPAEARQVAPTNRSRPVDDPRVAFDTELHPTAPWAYALDLAAPVTVEERPVGARPWSTEEPAVVLRTRGAAVSGWGLEHGAAAPPPKSPVTGEPVDLELVPYGATLLRLTEMPVLG